MYTTITIYLSSKVDKKRINKFYEMLDYLALLIFGKNFYAIGIGKKEVKNEAENR